MMFHVQLLFCGHMIIFSYFLGVMNFDILCSQTEEYTIASLLSICPSLQQSYFCQYITHKL